MGGEISVASPVIDGIGTAFTFIFYLDIDTEQKEMDPVAAKSEWKQFKFDKPLLILIVDDNPVNLLVAKKMLTSFGAQTTVAENGQTAIDLVMKNNFDLILMDIQMPVMDGYATTKMLRELNFKKPILALSANVFSEHIKRSLDSGMNGHLQKPFNSKDLFTAIEEATKKSV
jgi:CheY-like chemotaxis protein